MSGEIQNYEGSDLPEVITAGEDKWIKVYNDGTALLNGAVVVVSFAKGADGIAPQAVAPATASDPLQLVGVVENSKLVGQTGIAAAAYGMVQVRGYCPKVLVDGVGVTAEHYLEVLTTAATATDDGTSKTTKSWGIARTTKTAGLYTDAWLFGKEVVVAGS